MSTAKTPVSYVDPMIGTDFFGHTFPGATLPFAMVQLSPDNDIQGWTYSSGYSYGDNTIMGFSHTHFSGTGMTAGGDIMFMPTTGDKMHIYPGPKDHPEQGYRSKFDHKDEIVTTGYYSVLLKDYNIKVELTATRRAGMHRYTFPKARKATILIDLGHEIGGNHNSGSSQISIKNDSTIEGYKNSSGTMVYFVAEFNKPFHYYGTFDAGYQTPESGGSIFPYKNEERGKNIGSFVNYTTEDGDVVLVKVGISYVNIDGARKNLEAEIPGWDFDQVHHEARETWNNAIKKVTVEGATEDKKTIFYTAVYHSLLAQQISEDVDGQYFGMDGKIHKADGKDFYPSFSCWDTYRTEHPLMTIIAPEHVNDMIRSIVQKTRNFGWLPAQHFRNVFDQGMVGDHLVPIITDAFMKGFRDYDVDFIYDAMRKKALELPKPPLPPTAGRSGLQYYIDLGYAPCDKVTESVPNTLELSYNDWCIAQMAKALGKQDDYEMFLKRANNYKNVYDPESKFMRPRKADGSWLEALDGHTQEIIQEGDHSYYKYFDPLLVGRRPNRHYTESNAWQYLWSVQHDPEGLIKLLGGDQPFVQRLDTFFSMSPIITPPKYVGVVGTIGQYVHGNQPSHHVAYLYDYAGQPWKTQEMSRKVMEELYRTGPGGICGNEDMGSLSSWYVLSAMGFYPVTPASTEYAIGSPIFNEVTIQVDEGKTFKIIANNNSKINKYIQSATLNGQPLDHCWIDHTDIIKGGVLEFEMGPNPNKQWASSAKEAPYSMSGTH